LVLPALHSNQAIKSKHPNQTNQANQNDNFVKPNKPKQPPSSFGYIFKPMRAFRSPLYTAYLFLTS